MIVADLHIHSRYSRATARDLDPERLWLAAQRKGVDLLGSGDFTHPAWLAELQEKLIPTGDGAYELKPQLAAPLAEELPPSCRRAVRFLLSGEISCIYKRGGRTRKVHSLILLPDFAAAERVNARLGRLGNIVSDGRPILGLDTRDLLELCLEAEPSVIFIPAHIWTPWFSLFGSNSGFDAIEDCFADLTPHIHALETGLSSDPPMNWRLSALDRFALVSHSDAHSPANLAREADLFTCAPTYQDVAQALAEPESGGLAGTLEFFPDEGKYHLDGHRKCGVRLSPEQTRAVGGRCPVCGGALTVGVLSRVEELADRPLGQGPPTRRTFESLVPLAEVLSEVMQRGPATKGVRQTLDELLRRLGPELEILRQSPLEELAAAGGPLLAEAVRRMREGQVWAEGGYDGEFGVVRLFTPAERQKIKGQGALWSLAPESAGRAAPPAPAADPPQAPGKGSGLLKPVDPALEGLNPEQAQAVAHRGVPLLVRAGPGTGKTRVLVQRAISLVQEGLEPARLLMITFTRKAAAELRERLSASLPAAGAVKVGTFHSLGREILTQALGDPPAVLDEDARLALLGPLARKAELKPVDLAQALTRAKQALEPPDDPQLAAWLADYQALLRDEGFLDLDDLVREAALRLGAEEDLAGDWRGRFAQVLVDEYQDVNPAQVALLQALGGESTQFTAIGDPDQAIYGFRGADRALLANFGRQFPGAQVMGLTRNYRSAAPILNLAQSLMAQDPDPARPRLIASRPGGARPVLCELASAEAEAQWLAARVVELLGGVDSRQVEGGAGGGAAQYGAADIAVLYRLHAQAPILQKALERAGVPVQVASREPLAETDPLDFRAQRVSLLTMHAAKGLEFPVVFLVGLEEGLLPYQPPEKPTADLDEERRLLFVAMTRARERLYLCRARERAIFGQARRPAITPLLAGLEPSLWESEKPAARRRRVRQLGLFAD
jgi:DNA helicase-2/ATP-dependent DNA helicase PcrA